MSTPLATATTEIAEYSPTEAALARLAGKYTGIVYDVESKSGMEAASVARAELRSTRLGLEQVRKQIKDPALRRCQMIDSEARRITAQIVALEEPIDEQIKVVTERKKREEAAKAQEMEARRVAAEQALAEERAKLEAERAKFDAEKRAQQEALDTAARERERARQDALDAQRRTDAQAEWDAGAKARADAEAAENLARREREAAARSGEGVQLLKTFVDRFGLAPEFVLVAAEIRAFLESQP